MAPKMLEALQEINAIAHERSVNDAEIKSTDDVRKYSAHYKMGKIQAIAEDLADPERWG